MGHHPGNNEVITRWKELEQVLDTVLKEGEQDTAPEFSQLIEAMPDLQKSEKWLSESLEKSELFDQGACNLVPDLFDQVAGLTPDLNQGQLMSRYRIIKPLGSGGMGDVYLVERADGQYQQQVALKILSAGLVDPVLLNRFRREVQILAELRHPGIASLLDAGIAEDGRPWFVADYIQGIPLTTYCTHQQLGRKAVIKLFIKVCEAVAFAHDHGVLHRDLKPENILVEGGTDNPQPVVLDFGIASREQDDELTRAGSMLGTPAYGSPEQAKGDFLSLSKRSDVFSLGIILFELIGKRKPFQGDSNTEISYHIIHQDTPTLGREDVSPDLAAIIFKCLNKSPSDRYASVASLIQDLERYQQGKSVDANPVGPWFRIKRKVRRYPVVSALVLITTAVVLFLGGVAAWQYGSKSEYAAQQAQVAQHFGQAAQQIESNTRLVYSRPLHNIEKEIKALETRYQALAHDLQWVDTASQPVARYALGRAALSLRLFEQAQEYMEQAWDTGLKEPLLALRLGQVYMHLHARAVQGMSLISERRARELALEKAREDYLRPARKFLSVGAASGDEDAKVAQAMVHLIDGDSDSSLSVLQEAIDSAVWPVVALISTGNIYLELAEDSQLKGDNKAAIDYFRESHRLFENASLIARSHPDSIKGKCVTSTRLIQAGRHQEALQLPENIKSIPACESLLILQPGDADSLIHAGEAYASAGRRTLTQGDNPSEVLARALNLVNTVLQQQPENAQVLRLLGTVKLTKSSWVFESGGSGDEILRQAVIAFESAATAAPGDIILLRDLAQALNRAARMEYANGGDGDPAYAESSRILQQLTEQDDAPLSAWVEYANGLSWQGYYRYSSGRDADNILQRAVEVAASALEKSPQGKEAIKASALAAWTLAELQYLKGEDPAQMSSQAVASYQKGIDIDPDSYVLRINQLGPMALAIDFQLDQGFSQQKQLDTMDQLLRELQQRVDDKLEAGLLWADYWRYKSKQSVLDGQDPTHALQFARDYLKAALTSTIDRYEAVQSLGYQAVFEHRWRLDAGQQDMELYNRDMAALTRAIEEYPDLPLLRALRGRLRLVNATTEATLLTALQDLDNAIQNNPLLGYRYGQYLAALRARYDD